MLRFAVLSWAAAGLWVCAPQGHPSPAGAVAAGAEALSVSEGQSVGPDELGTGYLNQSDIEVTAGADGWLVTWAQEDFPPLGRRVLATRVDASGAVVDPVGIPLGLGANGMAPRAAFDGQRYHVVWSNGYYGSADILSAVVESAGNGEPSAVRVLVPGGGPRADIAARSQDLLVAYTRDDALWVMRVDPTGVPIAGELQVSSGGQPHSMRIASHGSESLVAWLDGDVFQPRVAASRVSTDMTIVESATLATVDVSSAPEVAWDGTRFVVTWLERTDLRFRTVPAYAESTIPAVSAGAASMTRTDAGLVAVFADDGEASAMLLDDMLQVQQGPFDLEAEGVRATSIGAGAGSTLAGLTVRVITPSQPWEQSLDRHFIRRLASNGEASGAAAELSRSAAQHRNPRVGAAAGAAVVGWTAFTPNGRDAQLTRLDAFGVPDASAGASVSSTYGGLDPDSSLEHVASAGDQSLVLWSTFMGGLSAARLDREMTFVDAQPMEVVPATEPEPNMAYAIVASDAVVASNGDDYLLAYQTWISDDTSPHDVFVHLARIGRTGPPTAVGEPLPAWQDAHALAAVGKDYLLVYPVYNVGLVPVLIRSDALTPLATLPALARHARVASDGEHALIVWDSHAAGPVNAMLIDPPAGTTLWGPEPISPASASGYSPDVVFDGSRYVVVWDQTTGTGPGALVGTTIGKDGKPERDVESPFVVVSDIIDPQAPSLASPSAGITVVAYLVYDVSLNAQRTQVRTIDTTEDSVPVDAGADGTDSVLPTNSAVSAEGGGCTSTGSGHGASAWCFLALALWGMGARARTRRARLHESCQSKGSTEAGTRLASC